MKKIYLFLIGLLLSCVALAQPSDTYLLNRLNNGHMPGASFVVIKDGHWVFNRNLGKANLTSGQDITRHTVFMLASISKTMTATAVMQLWEKGLIDLDVNIDTYLPFQVHTPAHPADSITMRMLLTHTSAIQDDWNVMIPLYVFGDSPISLDTFVRNYLVPGGNYYSAANFYNYKPGLQYNYSNIASTLAAYVVERITGDPFSHYCDTAIFQKLCMTNTSFLLSGLPDTNLIARPYSWDAGDYYDMGLYGYPDYPDGQLRTNITALARFMTMYMQGGIYEGTRVLDSNTVNYMLQQQTNAGWYQGLIFYAGLASNGDTLWGHNGGDAGVSTAMYFNRAQKTGVIILTNGDGTSSEYPDLIADTLYKYGLTITPSANDTFPHCGEPTAVPFTQTAEPDFLLYPNPAGSTVNLRSDLPGIMILSNLQGQVLKEYSVQRGDNKLTLPQGLPSGFYVVSVYDIQGSLRATFKLGTE